MRSALRWVAVLPAAIAGYALVVIGVNIAFAIAPISVYLWIGEAAKWLFGMTEDRPSVSVDIVSAFFRAWAFVALGARVAPSHRVQAALALSGAALAVLAFLLGAVAVVFATTGVTYWRLFLYAIVYLGLYVAGLVYAVRGVQKEVQADMAWSRIAATAGERNARATSEP